MGMLIANALPVIPGQEYRVRNFVAEVPPHVEEFERLNEEGTFTRYDVSLQEGPQGALAIHVFEVEDPTRVRPQVAGDTENDNWWLDYPGDVHGLDLRNIPPEQQPTSPPAVFTWPAG